jgi:hypothetical protein
MFALQYISFLNFFYSPANPHLARVVGYGLFSLCLIHKEGLCPSRGDITINVYATQPTMSVTAYADDDDDDMFNLFYLVFIKH